MHIVNKFVINDQSLGFTHAVTSLQVHVRSLNEVTTHGANVVVFMFLDFSWCRQKHTFWVKEVLAVCALK